MERGICVTSSDRSAHSQPITADTRPNIVLDTPDTAYTVGLYYLGNIHASSRSLYEGFGRAQREATTPRDRVRWLYLVAPLSRISALQCFDDNPIECS